MGQCLGSVSLVSAAAAVAVCVCAVRILTLRVSVYSSPLIDLGALTEPQSDLPQVRDSPLSLLEEAFNTPADNSIPQPQRRRENQV